MGKLDLSRRDGERLDAYVGRLEGLAWQAGLAAEDRAALAVSLAGAKALLRQQQAASLRGPPSAATPTPYPPAVAGEGDDDALEYCKALCRALPPHKQLRLLRWLLDGMPG
jgi:hypothetical protein